MGHSVDTAVRFVSRRWKGDSSPRMDRFDIQNVRNRPRVQSYNIACVRTSRRAMERDRGRGETERQTERGRHRAWTLMCLWGTNTRKVRQMQLFSESKQVHSLM